MGKEGPPRPRDCPPLPLPVHWKTAIERGLYKALHELQRLQADRAPADSIPPPVAVEVDAAEIPEGISARLALFGNNRI